MQSSRTVCGTLAYPGAYTGVPVLAGSTGPDSVVIQAVDTRHQCGLAAYPPIPFRHIALDAPAPLPPPRETLATLSHSVPCPTHPCLQSSSAAIASPSPHTEATPLHISRTTGTAGATHRLCTTNLLSTNTKPNDKWRVPQLDAPHGMPGFTHFPQLSKQQKFMLVGQGWP